MMNTKKLFGLGSVSFLLAVTGAQAAVSTAPAPGLNLVFDTDGSTQAAAVASTGTTNSTALGVGYDPGNSYNEFVNSATASTAQSVFNPLITDSSAAGAFTTISAGSTFQLALHADGLNNSNNNLPVTLYASLFKYNPGVGSGNIPIGSAIFQNIGVDVLNSTLNQGTDSTFFSSTFTLANTINAGTEYVLAVDGGPAGGSSPTSFATVDRSNFAASGLPSTDSAIYKQYFLIDNNSGDTGGAYNTYAHSAFSTQPLGYRFYAGTNAVPEASSIISLGTLLTLGGMFLVRRRIIKSN